MRPTRCELMLAICDPEAARVGTDDKSPFNAWEWNRALNPQSSVLIYIHGFNSSPASSKAQLLKAKLEALGRGAEFFAPALPHSPAQAAGLLDALALRHPGAALVGSSLGGYYATWLAEKRGLKAALLNPVVRPYELLAPLVGRQKNFHTGEEHDFTTQHVAELRALEVERVTPARYLLIVAKGDEVLDYRRTVERYRGCRQLVIEDSDHGLSDFADYADAVIEFCGVSDSKKH